jgi:hypothetical protein
MLLGRYEEAGSGLSVLAFDQVGRSIQTALNVALHFPQVEF